MRQQPYEKKIAKLAVRNKFLLLLLLTLALMFDVMVRPPRSKLFQERSLPSTSALPAL
ncbi:MAG: hypothetical protein AAGF83_21460 [Cyanobacteria bacterium P01_G01_bin.67]